MSKDQNARAKRDVLPHALIFGFGARASSRFRGARSLSGVGGPTSAETSLAPILRSHLCSLQKCDRKRGGDGLCRRFLRDRFSD